MGIYRISAWRQPSFEHNRTLRWCILIFYLFFSEVCFKPFILHNYPYYIMPLGRHRRECRIDSSQHNYTGFSIDFQHRPLPSAPGLPKTARARHAPPTQQPSRSSAKERAPSPASAREDFCKSALRSRQITTIFFGVSGRP
ncbi:unnamed protein product [Laminaria digitata]